MTIKGMAAAVVASSALTLTASMTAAPANADAPGTVKARTQRMSDANLGSQQNGWYNPGDRLTLVCSRRGQPVKGFFSFNIPNGGWDNLWYKTSDGHFVADVDIETGTLKDVTPDCGNGDGGGAAPAPAPSKIDAALAKANSVIGSTNPPGDNCAKFVAWAFNQPGTGYPTAKNWADHLPLNDRNNPNVNFPRGALVFSESSFDGGAGHVDIAQGNGTFISGGVLLRRNPDVFGVKVLNEPNNSSDAHVLGWIMPPW